MFTQESTMISRVTVLIVYMTICISESAPITKNASAKKEEESFIKAGGACTTRCPESMPNLGDYCDERILDGCACTYADESSPYCHLQCSLDWKWAMTCTSRIGEKNIGQKDDQGDQLEDDNMCVCPRINPGDTCDSKLWETCQRTCTYANPLCSYSCEGDTWLESCIEHFDSNSTLQCADGRCTLSDECKIPREGGYWISGEHISGMIGEYLLTPDGCTGKCTGCILSSGQRKVPNAILYLSLGTIAVTALLF